jgi:hypothetical protein
VRFFLTNDMQADIDFAAPLSYRAPDNTARDVRVLFSLTTALKLCLVRAALSLIRKLLLQFAALGRV